MSDRVQSIERAIDILGVLAVAPKSLTQVARVSGLPKGTVYRLLSSLAYGDLVLKDPVDGVYALGPGLVRLTSAATGKLEPYIALARPELTNLWKATGETISLHVRRGLERVCIEELASPHSLRYTASVGASHPLHLGSAGKILLAFQEPARLPSLVASLTLTPFTPRTITDRQRLMAELGTVRRRGWATSEGERVQGAAAVSVPIRTPEGELISLSILGPSQRLTRLRLMELLPALRGSASTIERSLQIRDGHPV